jgi:hypothetical protein
MLLTNENDEMILEAASALANFTRFNDVREIIFQHQGIPYAFHNNFRHGRIACFVGARFTCRPWRGLWHRSQHE